MRLVLKKIILLVECMAMKHVLTAVRPNVTAKWVVLLFHIQEVLGSKLAQRMTILTEVFCDFP